MTSPAQAPPKDEAAKTSEYVVLKQTREAAPSAALSPAPRETWERIGGVFQGTGEQAIKKAAEGRTGSSAAGDPDVKEGTYVAVPARSFKPVSLKVETETRVKLS